MSNEKNKLIVHPTDLAQWHALINEAQAMRSLQLAEDLESYVVFLLMRFTSRPEIASTILASVIEYAASRTI